MNAGQDFKTNFRPGFFPSKIVQSSGIWLHLSLEPQTLVLGAKIGYKIVSLAGLSG